MPAEKDPVENRASVRPSTWYHAILTTYGAWLYGDARGFRTRHHREHIDGDYRNPPPSGEYTSLEQRSRDALKQDPVVLPTSLRRVVGLALRDRLVELGGLVACLAVGGQHVHVLAKMPRGGARHYLGKAKRHAWFVLRQSGWSGRLWGKRSKALLIRDRAHQLKVYHYILRHRREEAWVWSCAQGEL